MEFRGDDSKQIPCDIIQECSLGRWGELSLQLACPRFPKADFLAFQAIACQTENTGGTTLEPADDGFLFLAATGKPVASAEVCSMIMPWLRLSDCVNLNMDMACSSPWCLS